MQQERDRLYEREAGARATPATRRPRRRSPTRLRRERLARRTVFAPSCTLLRTTRTFRYTALLGNIYADLRRMFSDSGE